MRSPQNIKNQVRLAALQAFVAPSRTVPAYTQHTMCFWTVSCLMLDRNALRTGGSTEQKVGLFALCAHLTTCYCCPCSLQVNYFNAKPEHVRDNKYLAARIELEDLLSAEPEIVKQRRDKLREVLIKVSASLGHCCFYVRCFSCGLCRKHCLLLDLVDCCFELSLVTFLGCCTPRCSQHIHSVSASCLLLITVLCPAHIPLCYPQGQSALPAGALQAAYAAAKLQAPNLGNSSGGRLHPYARPTSLQASYGMQAMSAAYSSPQMSMQSQQMQPQMQSQHPSPTAGMNAMMLLAQAACGDEGHEDAAAAAAVAAAAAPVPEGALKMEQEEMQEYQQASQHGVAGLQLPMIQTRPQHNLLQQKGSGGSSSSCKQPGSAHAQLWSYASGMQNSAMSMMMPGMMMIPGAQGSPMASSDAHTIPAPAAAALAAAQKGSTASPASTPMAAALDGLAATAGLSASDFAAMAAMTAGAMPRPSKSGSSQGTRRHTHKAARQYGDFMNGDDMSTSEEGDGEETGDLTPLAQRVAEAAAAAVSAATQQAVTATQQACQVLSMAQMLAQQAQQQDPKPAASDRSSQPSGVEAGSEQQMEAAVTQRLNNQHSTGLAAAAAAAAAGGISNAAAHRLDDAVRHLLESHYEKMQQLQHQLQHELQEQLATLGKMHSST